MKNHYDLSTNFYYKVTASLSIVFYFHLSPIPQYHERPRYLPSLNHLSRLYWGFAQ